MGEGDTEPVGLSDTQRVSDQGSWKIVGERGQRRLGLSLRVD